MYGINSAANAMMNSKKRFQFRDNNPNLTYHLGEEFKNDPRNPRLKGKKPAAAH